MSGAVAPTTPQPATPQTSAPTTEGGAPKKTKAQKKAEKAQAKSGAVAPTVPARVATVVGSAAVVNGVQVAQAATARARPFHKILSLLLPVFCAWRARAGSS